MPLTCKIEHGIELLLLLLLLLLLQCTGISSLSATAV
jgi:hypothetical protein